MMDINDEEEVKKAQDNIVLIMLAYFTLQKDYILNQLKSINILTSKSVKIDDEIDKKDLIKVINKIETELEIIGKVSSKNIIASLNKTKDKELIKKSLEIATNYSQSRCCELVGKRILKTGAIINNPNANYAITDTTRNGLKDLINKAMDNGWSNDRLANKIKENYLFSEQRSLQIARTETNLASNEITFKTFKEANIKMKKWLTAQDDRVSDLCVENGNQPAIPINSLFRSGHLHPAAHVNCRCTIIAVI